MQSQVDAITLARLATYRPPPKLTISEWADRERRLSPEASAEPGRWRTSRAEYLRGLMDAISDPTVHTVIVVFGSQLGKTEALLNALGFYIQHDPAPVLLVMPTLELAESWSKDRLAPMLRDSPSLRGKVGASLGRGADRGSTVRHKSFVGGHLTVAGANSPASLASRPIRILLCDEVDRFPVSAGSEGDPLSLAEARTASFWNARRVYVSSPTITGSRIDTAWEASDQRRFHVPCPDCGAHQTLQWAQVRWEKIDGEHAPETARYECERCGSRWSDTARRAAVSHGQWRASKPFAGVAGFHLNALYGPWESRNLSQLVRQFLEAKGDPERLKVFVNTVLAESWEEPGESIDESGLLMRGEDWQLKPNHVPDGVVVLTCGVDIQADRVEYEIVGWGLGEESWSIEYGRLYGDPRRPETLKQLDDVLLRPWRHPCGADLYIRMCCIDSGFATQAVYEFCAPRVIRPLPDGSRQAVIAIKGRGEPTRSVWPKLSPKSTTWLPVTLGVHSAKSQVMARLAIDEPGPGYCHFPSDRSVTYFEQLTAERLITKYRAGVPHPAWIPKQGRSNEALDCRVYAYSAIVGAQTEPFNLKLDTAISAPTEKAEDTPARPRPSRRKWKPAYVGRLPSNDY